MKLTESEVKELVKAALREAFINEGFMIKENVNNDWWTSVAYLQNPDDCEEFKIVGSLEADPFNNKISNESPLAKAIMNAKAGDIRAVESPNGNYEIKIVEIG